jgi:hypothetical protein
MPFAFFRCAFDRRCVACLWIVLRRFDRLNVLDVYHLPEYRGLHPKAAAGGFLPCVVGLLCLVTAAVLFLRARNQQDNAGSGTITLLNPDNSRP